ncbi:MAG: DUF1800 domain-containing protein [Vulcanimicrobiota bacterium]
MSFLRTLIILGLMLRLAGVARAELPYAQQDLGKEEAAAHLLSRFSFGPTPGQVEQVAQQGLENWFEQQLKADLPENELQARLEKLPAITMTSRQISATYPQPGLILRQAEKEGIVPPRDEEKKRARFDDPALRAFMEKRGYRPLRELLGTLFAQKILRANESPNQLREVMTDFWFNHFNVSLTDNQARPYLLAYERDAIRPNALGRFRDLLEATAKHPAMLLYLDNAQSSANPEAATTSDMMADEMEAPRREAARAALKRMARRKKGINENYARELMELHTLGVDGGYSQQDVTEVARAFTGWTMMPPNPDLRPGLSRLLERGGEVGVVEQGDFLFVAPFHDAQPKSILGRNFPAGRGQDEGEQVLDILSVHPSTARHLAHKLAVRFVSDQPPASLEERLARSYLDSQGQIPVVLRTLVHSPEFWSPEARRAKIKSPLELAVSAARATGASITPSRPFYDWLAEMGQPLYAYQAPTGFPDQADTWINSGTLLTRMNFGLNFALGEIPGIRYDKRLLKPKGSPEKALTAYARRLLPGRPVAETVSELLPAAQDPEFVGNLQKKGSSGRGDGGGFRLDSRQRASAKLVGLILGSPEFQRR